jgi:hypothetical protein
LKRLVSIIAVVSLCALLASRAPAQPNLVTNPGFETGNLTGWTQSGNLGFTGVGGVPHSGSFALFMGPIGSDGFLSQTIPTVSGALYDVSFWLQSDGLTPNDFSAVFDGATLFSQVNIPAQPYTQYTFHNVPGTGASTLLQFGFRNDPGFLQLDDISVTQVIPEPGSLAMLFGMGLSGAALFLRRRVRK